MFDAVHSMSVSKKLAVLIVSALFGMCLLTGLALVAQKRSIMEERETAVRQAVEVAYSVLAVYEELARKGILSEQTAKQEALSALRALRYSSTEYFWVNDMQPRMLMHPLNPELEGAELADYKDSSGKRLFREFVTTVEARGSGFVNYSWPKHAGEQPVPKVSYVKGFFPWGWVIGSGVDVNTVQEQFQIQVITSLFGATIFTLALVGLGLFIRTSLMRQLGGEPVEAMRIANQLAVGDLSGAVDIRAGDNDSMIASIGKMHSRLVQVVGAVRSDSEAIDTVSDAFATGTRNLARRNEDQVKALQETAAAMEQLTCTVRQNAGNAQQANELAKRASTVALKGGDAVAKVVNTMATINSSSKRIADIIGVIDGIAFQTNVLALNAAVEAARAGAEGQGFKVVAAEVRSLSQRSAVAAKEIKELIENSIGNVDDGSEMVARAGETMKEIVSSIEQVTAMVGKIAASSAEQNRDIAQVGQAIDRMDRVTQKNAALVDTAASSIHTLRDRATHLVQVVSAFNLHVGSDDREVVAKHPPVVSSGTGDSRAPRLQELVASPVTLLSRG